VNTRQAESWNCQSPGRRVIYINCPMGQKQYTNNFSNCCLSSHQIDPPRKKCDRKFSVLLPQFLTNQFFRLSVCRQNRIASSVIDVNVSVSSQCYPAAGFRSHIELVGSVKTLNAFHALDDSTDRNRNYLKQWRGNSTRRDRQVAPSTIGGRPYGDQMRVSLISMSV
jgi:hypothetical protein